MEQESSLQVKIRWSAAQGNFLHQMRVLVMWAGVGTTRLSAIEISLSFCPLQQVNQWLAKT